MRLVLLLFLWLFITGRACGSPDGDSGAGAHAEGTVITDAASVKPTPLRFLKSGPLSQNQPNPALDFTIIYFAVSKPGPVSLKLFNFTGREIGYFVDGFCTEGTYRVFFPVSVLARGEYFYRLKTADFTCVKKMIVVK